jgi:hypothetical protein
MRHWRSWVSAWLLLPALLAGAAPATDAGRRSVLIPDVPHVRQKPDFCGEACAEMFMKKLGSKATQDDVFNASGLDPRLGRGCRSAELGTALEKLGFDIGPISYPVAPTRAGAELGILWNGMLDDLALRIPSIICMRTGDNVGATEHFRLILGFDATTDEIIYHEPAADKGAYQRMKRPQLLSLWPLKYRPDQWTVIRFRLNPRRLVEPTPPAGHTSAHFAQHVMELKTKIPARGFSMVIESPFMVIGDEPPEVVETRAANTVRWAVTRLKAAYFKKDPNDIIDIWLFKDKKSYDKHCQEIFNDTPTTPFGYSSSEHKALIMNINTGGGTLVHEIVHPFITANFPACPSWFNEGLASLYEQSSGDGDQIVGLTNWRLAGLQKAIRAGHLPSFRQLTGTTSHQFYSEDKGDNYAQARYLCYYLQEKGLLTKFYHQFVAHQKEDPTGYRTLQDVLDTTDMAAFQKRWESFVLNLRFP